MLLGRVYAEQYRVESTLFEGALSVAYKAWALEDGAPCTLHVLREEISNSSGASERFFQLAQRLSAIRDAKIVPWTDYGVADDDTLFWVENFTHERCLADALQATGAGLDAVQVTTLGIEVGQALSALHQGSQYHGGLSARWVWLPKSGASPARVSGASLSDLLAKAPLSDHLIGRLDRDLLGLIIRDGVRGARGLAEGIAGDIHAMGALLFRAATGASLYDVLDSALPTPAGRDRAIDQALERIAPALADVIRAATAERKGGRFAAAGALVGALEQVREELQGWSPQAESSALTTAGDTDSFARVTAAPDQSLQAGPSEALNTPVPERPLRGMRSFAAAGAEPSNDHAKTQAMALDPFIAESLQTNIAENAPPRALPQVQLSSQSEPRPKRPTVRTAAEMGLSSKGTEELKPSLTARDEAHATQSIAIDEQAAPAASEAAPDATKSTSRLESTDASSSSLRPRDEEDKNHSDAAWVDTFHGDESQSVTVQLEQSVAPSPPQAVQALPAYPGRPATEAPPSTPPPSAPAQALESGSTPPIEATPTATPGPAGSVAGPLTDLVDDWHSQSGSVDAPSPSDANMETQAPAEAMSAFFDPPSEEPDPANMQGQTPWRLVIGGLILVGLVSTLSAYSAGFIGASKSPYRSISRTALAPPPVPDKAIALGRQPAPSVASEPTTQAVTTDVVSNEIDAAKAVESAVQSPDAEPDAQAGATESIPPPQRPGPDALVGVKPDASQGKPDAAVHPTADATAQERSLDAKPASRAATANRSPTAAKPAQPVASAKTDSDAPTQAPHVAEPLDAAKAPKMALKSAQASVQMDAAKGDSAAPPPRPRGSTGNVTTSGDAQTAPRIEHTAEATAPPTMPGAPGLLAMTVELTDTVTDPGPVAGSSPSAHSVPIEMVLVPAGRWTVGCRSTVDGCRVESMPDHEVQLPAFGIQSREVSVDQYDECIREGTCTARPRGPQCSRDKRGPANCVTHVQAELFCQWRGWRLPTESEWEVAARGGTQRRFPWGSQRPSCERTVMSTLLNGDGCGAKGPRLTASTPGDRSWSGALDMGGNVAEWTSSPWRPYRRGRGFADASHKVVRGGHFKQNARTLPYVYHRDHAPPAGHNPSVGFRCAVSLKSRH